MKKNQLYERKGEDASNRSNDLPLVPNESIKIGPAQGSGEESSGHNIDDEPLLVEEGYRDLHIEVPIAVANDNGSMLTIIPISAQVV